MGPISLPSARRDLVALHLRRPPCSRGPPEPRPSPIPAVPPLEGAHSIGFPRMSWMRRRGPAIAAAAGSPWPWSRCSIPGARGSGAGRRPVRRRAVGSIVATRVTFSWPRWRPPTARSRWRRRTSGPARRATTSTCARPSSITTSTFANESGPLGLPAERPLTPNGHRLNQHAAGSAVVRAPFFVAAHVYVRAGAAIGLHSYEADGLQRAPTCARPPGARRPGWCWGSRCSSAACEPPTERRSRCWPRSARSSRRRCPTTCWSSR